MDKVINHIDLQSSRIKIFVAICVFALVATSWLGVFDKQSLEYIDDALVQASVAFAVARALNAVISVLQSVQVGVVAVMFNPGEALDPLNDLIEQFSSVMKFAIASLLIQKIMLEVVSATIFNMALSISGLALLICIYRRGSGLLEVSLKVFIFLAFLRFILAFAVLLNGVVANAFLEDKMREEVAVLDALPKNIESLTSEPGSADQTMEELQTSAKEELDRQQQELRARMVVLESEILHLNAARDEAVQALADVKATMTRLQILNPLNQNDKHAAAKSALSSIEKSLKNKQQEQRKLDRALQRIQRENTAMETVAKKEGGFWGSFGQGLLATGNNLAKIGDVETYKALIARFEGVLDTVMSVMTLFILRSVILPLLFMYAFTKVFKLIWKVDLEKVIGEITQQKPVEIKTV